MYKSYININLILYLFCVNGISTHAPCPGKVAGGGSESPGEGGKGARPRARGVDFPLRVLVSSDMVGAIIGRGGATIRNITQQSRARVDVHRWGQSPVLISFSVECQSQ